ncbi:restriction modification system specificity subunit [Staphylococcus schleiferi]|uniref:restriction endonuclease subunit S n=1 Tax=Staphylococcus coagulans TaxID=74706 RepID=UPI0006BD7CEE|nr:restriction endonuclease subunit S [Staphylococcus coagulans]BAS44950.1 restriction modification system specificity subunit [Staphylococcus schleiferi]MBT2830896.1 restriction endonuclease subunit S [Staphylococcus coagulans]MBT2859451.1 restriction endonuclease subunit S [Staphylococcus coagulans]MBU3872958.1 restriction endonuclease subunit S [Staphylococcus coagulans]PNZ12660.1 restriction endonuclease subunit S [Staphylococcus coagulans]
MTNETKNIPELRFPEFEGEWDEKELGDIGEKVKTKNKFEKFDETFTNSAEQGIVSQKEYFEKDISNSKNLSNYYVVENNDFVYNPRISNYAPVGPINRNKLKRTGIMSPLYTIFKMRKVDYTFCEYFFSSTKWHNFMKFNGDSGARSDRFSIKDSIFFKMPIKVPTNLEQQKIGDFFSKLDRQIELEEKKLALLEEQKKGYMQQIFSQELRFKDENGNNYPEWETLKVKDIAETFRGLTYKPEDIRTEGVRVLRSSNIIKDKIHFYEDDIFVDERVVKIPLVDEDDILITAANGSPKLVGKHAIIEKLKDKSVAGGFMYILRSNYSKFMQIWMSTTEYRRIISRVQGGNGSIGNLSRNDLENGNITLPCNEEKSKIGNFFKKIDELIERQYTKIELLKKRKQGLLQKMFV